MNVWLIKDGENLPIQPDARKMRTWMLAEELLRQGHEVVWWASTHSHQRKTLLCDGDREFDIAPGFKLRLLSAGAYRNNRSVGRLLHHSRLATRFRRQAAKLPPPHVIVSAFPTIELAYEAVAFARSRRIPVILDIRDPWPDVFVNLVPAAIRAVVRAAFWPLDAKTRAAIAGADSVVACSRGFLEWGLGKAGLENRHSDRVFYLGKERPTERRPSGPSRISALGEKLAGKVVFCFVGSFGNVYELGLVCQAAARLDREGNFGAHFVFAGDGEQRDQVHRAARHFRNVSATGWLSGAEVEELLSIAHVGLAPYRQLAGAIPNKLFDYAAAGLPILTSLEGEAVDLLAQHRAGCAYTPGDLEGLLSRIRQLAADERMRREFAAGSARMFESEFAAEHIYPEYVNHVESVVRAREH